jgi:PAS domain-containing protein
LRVVAASRSFYLTFRVRRQDTQGRMLYALGDGQWDIPALRALLEKIAPEHGELDGYEVRHAFPEIGERVMLLNARKVFYEGNNHSTILLGFEDITERRAAEREMQLLLEQKDLLLQEMQHRIAIEAEQDRRVIVTLIEYLARIQEDDALAGLRLQVPLLGGGDPETLGRPSLLIRGVPQVRALTVTTITKAGGHANGVDDPEAARHILWGRGSATVRSRHRTAR